MKVIYDLTKFAKASNSMITIGNFDGIHYGHTVVLNRLIQQSKKNNCKSIVFSFNPHPKINEEYFSGLIYSLETKNMIFNKLGIDIVIYLDFDQVKTMKYDCFLKKILQFTEIKGFVANDKLKFGLSKQGNPKKIQSFFDNLKNPQNIKTYNPKIDIVPAKLIKNTNKKLSSSLIRKLITTKKLELACDQLFLPFHLKAKVVKGKQMGRLIGFPTLNFTYPEQMVKLPPGNYITLTLLKNEIYTSISFVGIPFGKNDIKNSVKYDKKTLDIKNNLLKVNWVETHLLNFTQSVYNYTVIIFFLSFMGPPVKTKNLTEVKKIIESKKSNVVIYFKENKLKHKKIIKKIKQVFGIKKNI